MEMLCSGNNRGMSQKHQLIDRVYKRHATRIFHVNLTVSCFSPVWINKNLSPVISKFVASRIQRKHVLETPFIWQMFTKWHATDASMSICPCLLRFLSTGSLLQSIIIMSSKHGCCCCLSLSSYVYSLFLSEAPQDCVTIYFTYLQFI